VSLVSALACAAQPVTQISAGGWHNLFLKADGSLWATGDNWNGQLGNGFYERISIPELIVSSNVTAVAGGQDYSVFLTRDGCLWAMRDNNSGSSMGSG